MAKLKAFDLYMKQVDEREAARNAEVNNDPHETIRDRFAMAALTGIAASGEAASIPTKDIPSVLSKAAYEIADAMILARKQ